MSKTEKWIIFAMFAIPVAILALVLFAPKEPTCESRGGTSHLTGFIPIVTVVGKMTVINNVPQFECVFPAGSDHK